MDWHTTSMIGNGRTIRMRSEEEIRRGIQCAVYMAIELTVPRPEKERN